MTALSKHLERVAREGKTKIRETQAAECVTFLATLSGQPATIVLSFPINGKRLDEWLKQENLDVGRIIKQAHHNLYGPY
jgi:hypothetical protein